MKLNVPITLIFAVLLVFGFSACKKNKPEEPGITGCPTGSTCETLYTEHADVADNGNLKPGDFRIFWMRDIRQVSTTGFANIETTFFIKAPQAGNSFELNSEQIHNGSVIRLFSCPNCDAIDYEVIGGNIKGFNTTPEVRLDRAKWLLEGKIYLASKTPVVVKDTIHFKNYFTPNFIYY